MSAWTKRVRKNTKRKEDYKMYKTSLPSGNTQIMIIYAPNRAPKYMKQNLRELKGGIDNWTIKVGNNNIHIPLMHKIIYQNVNNEIEDLNDTTDKLDMTDIYRTQHSSQQWEWTKCTFFSKVQGTFSRIAHILDHKTRFNTLKRIKIRLSFNLVTMEWFQTNKKKCGKLTNVEI